MATIAVTIVAIIKSRMTGVMHGSPAGRGQAKVEAAAKLYQKHPQSQEYGDKSHHVAGANGPLPLDAAGEERRVNAIRGRGGRPEKGGGGRAAAPPTVASHAGPTSVPTAFPPRQAPASKGARRGPLPPLGEGRS